MRNLIRLVSPFINNAKLYNTKWLLLQSRFASSRTVATKNIAKEDIDTDDEGPIKYTQSPAYKWSAKSSRTGGPSTPRLWYEQYVILGSLFVFMIYFFVLREENHIDKELECTLYSRISGLEQHQLQESLNYNKSAGLSTTDIETRMKELSKI